MEERRKPGRPKGSANKPKDSASNVITVNMEKQILNIPRTLVNPQGWINWGDRNDFPNMLEELYFNSPTNRAAIDFIAENIVKDIEGDYIAPNYTEDWGTFLNKLALDLTIYGGYAFQIIKNKDNKTHSFFHQPFATVRCAKPDENDVISGFYICKDWTEQGKYKPFYVKRFGFQDEKISQGEVQLFYYSRYTVGQDYYPLPAYYSAIKAIQTECELIKYDLKCVLNNFSANGIITLDRIDDETERKQVIKGIQSMFTGADNANTVVVTFKNNSDDQPVQFTPFDKNSDSVNLFGDNNDRTINRILAAHKISNSALIGIVTGGSGFNSEAAFLDSAYKLLEKTVLRKMRKELIDVINKMFLINGINERLDYDSGSFIDNQTESVDKQTNE